MENRWQPTHTHAQPPIRWRSQSDRREDEREILNNFVNLRWMRLEWHFEIISTFVYLHRWRWPWCRASYPPIQFYGKTIPALTFIHIHHWNIIKTKQASHLNGMVWLGTQTSSFILQMRYSVPRHFSLISFISQLHEIPYESQSKRKRVRERERENVEWIRF